MREIIAPQAVTGSVIASPVDRVIGNSQFVATLSSARQAARYPDQARGSFHGNQRLCEQPGHRFHGNISADGTTITAGTFTITGGCSTGEHGTLTGFQMASMIASYTGSFTSGSNTLTVSSSPHQRGGGTDCGAYRQRK